MSALRWWVVAWALGLSACAAGGDRSGEVRSLEQLPAHYRSVWESFRSADPGWPALRDEVRADPSLRDFVVDNLVREMLLAYGEADLSQAQQAATRHFRRTRAELLSFPTRASEVLSELLGIGNGAAAFLAGESLLEIGRPALPAVLAKLESPEEQSRQWSARLLGELPNGLEYEDAVLTALARHLAEDGDWLTRAQCAESLGKRGSRARTTQDLRRVLVQALADPDGGVRRAAAGGLAELDDPAAVPALIGYLERGMGAGDLPECLAAETALCSLTGAPRGLGVKGWRDWWRARRP